MTEKEAIEIFEKVHTPQEQWKMENDIHDISNILIQKPINMYQVRTKIQKVNYEHSENIILYNLIFPPQGNRVSLANASDQSLVNDLVWKRTYLQAKKIGKAFEEFYKDMRKNFHAS